MKLKALSAAVAVGLVTSANVWADANPRTPTYTIYIGGATASQDFVQDTIIDKVCATGAGHTIDLFAAGTSAGYKNFVINCSVKTTLPNGAAISPGVVNFVKKGDGGSFSGSQPLAEASPQTYIDPKNMASCSVAAAAVTTGAGTPYNINLGCTFPNISVAPDMGLTDVEPELFRGPNKSDTDPAFDPASKSNIRSVPLAGLVFNVPVTTSLRDALQAAQFSPSSPCHPGNPASKVAVAAGQGSVPAGFVVKTGVTPTKADTIECMPSLTSQEIAGLATGQLKSWEDFKVNGTSLLTIAAAAGVHTPNTPAAVAGEDKRVHVCRRVPGSGTQAEFNALYLNDPCAANVRSALRKSANINFGAGPIVLENSGAGDVDKCLDDLQQKTNSTGLFATNRFAWAIGINSTERNQDLGFNYRFIRVNGYAPRLDEVWAGNYFQYAETTCQLRTTPSLPLNADIVAANATADVGKIFDNVCASDKASLNKVNKNFVHVFGEAGWLGIPSSTVNPDTTAFVNTNPINTSTRFGNTCQPQLTVKPVNVNRARVTYTPATADGVQP